MEKNRTISDVQPSDLKRIRSRVGINQKLFGRIFGKSVIAVVNWERDIDDDLNAKIPGGVAHVVLELEADPGKIELFLKRAGIDLSKELGIE